MHTIQLTGEIRTDFGKTAAKQFRKTGMIPCSLYGKGKDYQFSIPEKEIRKVVYTPEVYLVDLNLNNKIYKAVVKTQQFHPVHDYILNVEFFQVSEEKLLQVDLPVKLVGTSQGVLAGGKLVQKARRLRVRGPYSDLPPDVEIDITELRLGRSLKVGDLSFEKFIIAMPKDVPIASVELTRALRQEGAQQAKAKK